MGFTVTHEGETKNGEFQAYVRLLRQSGLDIGNLPRILEPGTGRHWLHVWKSKEDAQVFARELQKQTRDKAWCVREVKTHPSEGPLGPIIIQVARRSNGLIFALHPLSRAMMESAFPTAQGVSTVSMETEKWHNYQATQGDLVDLAQQMALMLTALSVEQLEALGYSVVDSETGEELVSVAPAE